MKESLFCSGVGAFAERFDAFLVDQWGVLHNGVAPYPGAVACLARLREFGKPVVILSNSGKRAASNLKRLAVLGFPAESYTALVTSGEVAWHALQERSDPFYADLGRRCFRLAPRADPGVLDGLDLETAQTVETADFLLASSTNEPDFAIVNYEPHLRSGAKRGLPMLCTNPDLVGVTAAGLVPSPGALARRYEELGGQVHYVGKPYPEVYRFCFSLLGGMAPERVVAVGDSLQHDIAGGAAAGTATAFVVGGIHADRFSDPDDSAALAALAAEYAVMPDFTIPAFRW
ncbi:TIGR01459 family HAD-type hydrolase [Rhodospirillaceae bacterium SYSU D60014]|uniref:TIGR01459 family HAD-type hydrolase n=1 Tax=Virgifigura deserti TaxID=2268457 RepID=UPI000E66E363